MPPPRSAGTAASAATRRTPPGHQRAGDQGRPPRPAGGVGEEAAGERGGRARPGAASRRRARRAACGRGPPSVPPRRRPPGAVGRPAASGPDGGAPAADAHRCQRPGVPAGQRRGRRAVGHALGDEAAPRPAGPVVDDRRRLVPAPPSGLDQAPHRVDVLAEAQGAVEAVDRPQRRRAHDERGGRARS